MFSINLGKTMKTWQAVGDHLLAGEDPGSVGGFRFRARRSASSQARLAEAVAPIISPLVILLNYFCFCASVP